jgi:hypothetical protein
MIKSLSFQFKDLNTKMASAIQAMNEVVMLFNSQLTSYSMLITQFKSVESGLEGEDFDIRGMNFTNGVNGAVKCFKTV